ncbi:TfoX/Sxy family protein [Flagellimonas allohymeniacidonis]|uniref:TfoX family protein n=1 Tax=Flagellimonas allohymeniacidonis TaxID=2517819 RepID=A0A4Q8QH11_9FLAO|nr:TfoX/Sxy family protein [Allomuricauda hymeniacidonis]TAI48538.1 TfoX family protein [Allomuricauda hymeniacidonis]
MAYNQELVIRIQNALRLFPEEFSEKKMFGGLSFLYLGKMTVGVIKDEMVVRVPSNKMDKELSKPFTRPMNFTGKPMKEFVFVSEEGFQTEEQLQYWIEMGLEHAKSKLES